jgi:hypothetical protein
MGLAVLSQVVVAVIAAIVFGKDLSEPTPIKDLGFSLLASSFFLMIYTVDLMSIGHLRTKFKLWDSYVQLDRSKTPEALLLAERAATNQSEQLGTFFVALWLGTFLLNARFSGICGLLWVALRALYVQTLRTSDGQKWAEKNVGKFTIPCYFLISTMLMGSTVNVLRTYPPWH